MRAATVKKFVIAFLSGAVMVSGAWAGASLVPVPDDKAVQAATPAAAKKAPAPTPASAPQPAAAEAPAPVTPPDPASLADGQVLAGAAKTSIEPRPQDYDGTWEKRPREVRDAQRERRHSSATTPPRWATTSPPPARRGRRTRTASTWAASASAR